MAINILISEDDFVGKWELAKSNDDKIDEYIQEYEEQYLIELLGKELYDLFKADLTAGVPGTQIYKDIFDPFSIKISQAVIITSKGMKKMLTGLIYFQYVKDNKTKQSMNGAVTQQTEVSTPSDNTFLYQRYNDAVRTYQAIQTYIIQNIAIYPTFAGVVKKKTSFI
jgi:hypothetical protein